MSKEVWLFVMVSIVFVVLFGSLLTFVIIYIRRQIAHKNQLEKIRKRNEASLLRATLTAQEKERERIGANLHDDIGPLLSSVKMFFKKEYKKATDFEKEELEAFLVALDENIEQVRDTSRDMVPNVLKNFGLKAAISEIIRRFSNDNSLSFDFTFDQNVHIPQEAQLPIYRIIQESITNAIRHGKAENIMIEIKNRNGFLITIRDNGTGFDLQTQTPGLGLRNIEARAKSIDAELKVISYPGQGTTIQIEKN